MSLLQANLAGLGGSGAPGGALAGGVVYSHQLNQSLRFEDGDSPALSKAYSTAQTNTKKLTISVWVKRGNLGIRSTILFAKSTSAGKLSFQTTDKLYFNAYNTGYNGFESNAVFRDTSAWYHIVAQADSETQTGANINRVYVNGVLLENSKTSVFVPDDTATKLLANGITTYIGDDIDGAYHFDGYLAEMHVIDGSVVAHTEFGETSNGVWVPKAYSGSYGNNGFYLSFADSANIGDDLSGNTNDFTVSNLAATDVVPDSPTNNFATFNNLIRFSATTDPVFSEGNLQTRPESDGISYKYTGVGSTINVSSGKWYAEFKPTATSGSTNGYIIGIIEQGLDRMTSNSSGSTWDGGYIYGGSGTIQGNGNAKTTSWGDTFTTDDVIGVAIDMDDGKLWFSKNGVFQASGDPAAGTNAAFTTLKTYNDTYAFSVGCGQTSSQYHQYEGNFGQNPSFNGTFTGGDVGTQTDGNGIGLFKYAPPSGFLALCTSNLPEPTIGPNSGLNEQADDYFNTVLYTGDGSTSNAITGVGFSPDFVWIKSRSLSVDHVLQDVVRGLGSGGVAFNTLQSSATDAEINQTDNDGLLSLDSDGFTVGYNNSNAWNASSATYASWNWKAGGTAVSNTDGSITSSVSANTDAGFSIVSYTGTGSNATVGHGLSSAPELVIVKERDSTGQWAVQSTGLSAADKVVYLQTSGGESTKADHFNSTFPTITVFSVGTSGNTNGNTHPFIAYCFHSVEGYCKVGFYEGNGNANGTFVYTGFRPAWIMVKEIDASGFWMIQDNKIYPFNDGDTRSLAANDTGTESTISGRGNEMDILSNGFKMRASTGDFNASNTHIYLAFAEAPFKYANAR